VVTIPEDEYRAQQGIIAHYGTPRHSGRYPWGSGETPQARSQTFDSMVAELKSKGLNEAEIARGLGFESTTEYRDTRTLLRNERKQDEIHFARKLKEKLMSNGAIAARMREAGYDVRGESQVRNLLKDSQERKAKVLDSVTDTLRKAVDEKEFVDVGSGVEFQLDISSTKLRSSLQKLKDEGYRVHSDIKVPQLGTDKFTNMRVLTKPGNEWGDVQRNRHLIQQINDYSTDGGHTILGILPPLSISSKRVGIRYDEDGGSDADGVIYVRPGVTDVSLGKSRYAQVRVQVDGSHYLKGMAVYKDDLPDGVDLQFNTNKKNTGDKLDAMKPLKKNTDGTVDEGNPFGASISRQIGDYDPVTGKVSKLTSVMNLVNKEGDWDKWSKTLSSQVLSKQLPALARDQLDLAYTNKKTELEGILSLTNPSVRRKLLDAYASGVDSASVHLKAAHLPRQKTQVIMPVNSLKDNEVYAPNFKPGEHVVLIRFPHGGKFEIPQLVVSHKNPEARKLLGNSMDAIGINSRVAERLSGADFDGDSVLVIPNNQGAIKTKPALEGLKNFDPKTLYAPYDGMKTIDGGIYRAATKTVDYQGRLPSGRNKGMQMGLVSNLITDMTIGGANSEELARAVKHSMVVIDAEKHNLDYQRSARDNGIPALMKSYQNSRQGGASTLISRASSPIKVAERKLRSAAKGGPIDRATGKKVYEFSDRERSWTDAKGKLHVRRNTVESKKLAETDDAHTLSSGTVIEKVYADHSNRLKSLADQARKELVTIKSKPYDPSARRVFASEVETLNAKVNLAVRKAPLERQAQVIANATIRLKVLDNPDLKLKENKAELKRLKSQALNAARMRMGVAEKEKFVVTENEWKAIERGAITAHKLDQILNYADLDLIKKLATPREQPKLTTSKIAKARSLLDRGYSWAEIADSLGVSVSTIQKELGTESEG
jgi:hypothetical protein